MMPENNLEKIEHIVVLMMENRSFDNVLGWLYDPDNEPPFNKTPRGEYRGVNSGMSNPDPDDILEYVRRGADPTAPYPDPNEPYEFVYRQMYDAVLKDSVKRPPPIINVPNTSDTPSMQGFVKDYANAIAKAKAKKRWWEFWKKSIKTTPDVIMDCFPPSYLPAINGLAQSYAVCDNWFSSVPTQTFPNRSFVHAATSSGNVYNSWKTGKHFWDVGVFINKTETIYNRLEQNKITWKIYHGGPLFLCNALITQEKLWEYAFSNERFFPFKQFLEDLKTPDALPAYTFIEPNMICSEKYGAENDMHPAYAVFDHGPPTDVRYGDKLIYDIYTALRKSGYWEKTLFIITFDEHGGCFDHIPTPPPPAVSPDGIVIPYTNGWDGGSGFDFKRFGVRVPAVLVSPWIEEGTICHTQFDHTSIIKTIANKWLGGQHLTNRDAAASDVSEVLSLAVPRKDTCEIKLNEPPRFSGCETETLSPLHFDMLSALSLGLLQMHGKKIDLKALVRNRNIVSILDDLADEFLGK